MEKSNFQMVGVHHKLISCYTYQRGSLVLFDNNGLILE